MKISTTAGLLLGVLMTASTAMIRIEVRIFSRCMCEVYTMSVGTFANPVINDRFD